MKKFLVLVLSMIMIFSLTSCGENNSSQKAPVNTSMEANENMEQKTEAPAVEPAVEPAETPAVEPAEEPMTEEPVEEPEDISNNESEIQQNSPDPRVGSFVSFGSYEQDNKTDNGKEPIMWEILDVNKDMALLLSDKCLDSVPFNNTYTAMTWERSTLRKWLNDSFFKAAFSEEDQKQIITTTNINEDNPEYHSKGGNKTEDKVFLLSISEVKKYLPERSERYGIATVFAQAKDIGPAYLHKNNDRHYLWWLRSPGNGNDCAAYIYGDGYIIHAGTAVDNKGYGVRPALWVDTKVLNNNIMSKEELLDKENKEKIDASINANMNTVRSNNRWESVFSPAMISIDGTYDGDKIQTVKGEIKNYTRETWHNCRIVIALFDSNNNYIESVSTIMSRTEPGETNTFIFDSTKSLFRYRATGFILTEISPNVVN